MGVLLDKARSAALVQCKQPLREHCASLLPSQAEDSPSREVNPYSFDHGGHQHLQKHVVSEAGILENHSFNFGVYSPV